MLLPPSSAGSVVRKKGRKQQHLPKKETIDGSVGKKAVRNDKEVVEETAGPDDEEATKVDDATKVYEATTEKDRSHILVTKAADDKESIEAMDDDNKSLRRNRDIGNSASFIKCEAYVTEAGEVKFRMIMLNNNGDEVKDEGTVPSSGVSNCENHSDEASSTIVKCSDASISVCDAAGDKYKVGSCEVELKDGSGVDECMGMTDAESELAESEDKFGRDPRDLKNIVEASDFYDSNASETMESKGNLNSVDNTMTESDFNTIAHTEGDETREVWKDVIASPSFKVVKNIDKDAASVCSYISLRDVKRVKTEAKEGREESTRACQGAFACVQS